MKLSKDQLIKAMVKLKQAHDLVEDVHAMFCAAKVDDKTVGMLIRIRREILGALELVAQKMHQ
jgi:hypothetical protein